MSSLQKTTAAKNTKQARNESRNHRRLHRYLAALIHQPRRTDGPSSFRDRSGPVRLGSTIHGASESRKGGQEADGHLAETDAYHQDDRC